MEAITLYDTDTKSKKTRVWIVSVEDKQMYAEIVVEYGFVDGKMVTTTRKVTQGKNIGKINETSYLEQAISEAKSKLNDKIKSGYTESLEKSKSNIILPMLALSFDKRYKDIVYPAAIQPKLDGVRAIYNVKEKRLQSRKGIFFHHLEHILEELKKVNINLDGELYTDKLTFQELVGLVKKEKLDNNDTKKMEKIDFIVYDIVDTTKDFKDRNLILQKLFKDNNFKHVKLLKTEIVDNIDQVYIKHKEYNNKGYEGLIIRNLLGKYLIKNRSKNLQKVKSFDDNEYLITGFKQGDGKEKGLIIFECETKQGKKFFVRPEGTYEERAELFKNGKDYIGKYLTVRHFELTSDGIPRFPVGIAIRDYE